MKKMGAAILSRAIIELNPNSKDFFGDTKSTRNQNEILITDVQVDLIFGNICLELDHSNGNN